MRCVAKVTGSIIRPDLFRNIQTLFAKSFHTKDSNLSLWMPLRSPRAENKKGVLDKSYMGAVNVRRKSHSELTNCCLQSGGGIAIPSWTTLWFSPRQSSQAVKTDFSTKNTALKTITCSFYHYPPLEPASRLSARLNFFFFFSFLSSLFTWLISCFLFSYFSFITALPKKNPPVLL